MILAFTKEAFIDKIKTGSKIHTIRADKNDRWKPGMKIQFYSGFPRVKRSNPYQFGTGVCDRVELVSIFPKINRVMIHKIGLILQDRQSLNEFAVCDGFKDWNEMKQFFNEDFFGKIIYWNQCNFYE